MFWLYRGGSIIRQKLCCVLYSFILVSGYYSLPPVLPRKKYSRELYLYKASQKVLNQKKAKLKMSRIFSIFGFLKWPTMDYKSLKNIESPVHFCPIFITILKMIKNRDEPKISDAPKNRSITNFNFHFLFWNLC